MSKTEGLPSPIDQEPASVSIAPPSPRVRYVEAMPNKMFPPQLTALLRFALAEVPIACAECTKPQRKLWTMLAPFHATTPDGFSLSKGPERAPLTLVCAEHPLTPADRIAEAIYDDQAPWPWEAIASEDEDEEPEDEEGEDE